MLKHIKFVFFWRCYKRPNYKRPNPTKYPIIQKAEITKDLNYEWSFVAMLNVAKSNSTTFLSNIYIVLVEIIIYFFLECVG